MAETLREVCLRAIVDNHDRFTTFRFLPTLLVCQLFDRMREANLFTTELSSIEERDRGQRQSQGSNKSALELFRGSDLPSLSLSSVGLSSIDPAERQVRHNIIKAPEAELLSKQLSSKVFIFFVSFLTFANT